MKRWLVVDGYYGMQNAGDDAFCVVVAEIARNRWKIDDLAFVATESRLPVLPQPARGVFPERVRLKGHGRFAPLAAMLRAGRVAHIGGSTFTSLDGRQRDQRRLAHLGLLSLHALAISVGPFASATAAREVVGFLRAFKSVSLRDSASAERIRSIDPTLTPQVGFDLAVLLPTLEFFRTRMETVRKVRSSGPPILGVSVCRDATLRGASSPSDDRREHNMIRSLRELAHRRQVSYRFIVFNNHPRWGDEDLSRRTAAALADSAETQVLRYESDVRSVFAAVAGCDAVLGTRLHSGIFAYASGTPFALVEYHPKCHDFAQEAALPDRFRFSANGPDPDRDVDSLAELLDRGREVLAEMLPLATAQKRARAGLAALDPT